MPALKEKERAFPYKNGATLMQYITTSNPAITITGRYETCNAQSVVFSFPGVSVSIKTTATTIIARCKDYGLKGTNNYFNVSVDGVLNLNPAG